MPGILERTNALKLVASILVDELDSCEKKCAQAAGQKNDGAPKSDKLKVETSHSSPQGSSTGTPATPDDRSPSLRTTNQLIGIVLPSNPAPGEQVSGSVVTDPERYKNIPGLTVVTATAPVSSSGSMEGLVVDTGDGKKQPVDKPFLAAIPIGVSSAAIVISMLDHPDQPIATAKIPIDRMGTALPASPSSSFTTPAVTQNGVQEIHGPITADVTRASATLDGGPTRILASRPGAIFLDSSRAVAPGPHEVKLFPSPDENPVRLTTHVIRVTPVVGRPVLSKGQTTTVRLLVDGAQTLPPSAWGRLTLSVENDSPGQVKLLGKQDVSLGPKDFVDGPATVTVKVLALRQGDFRLSWALTPLLNN